MTPRRAPPQDPGNWATDIAAGSEFGYTLLCAVLLSSIMAMFLQHLSLKLGIAAERDLAQACRDAYPRKVNLCLWLLAEVAIVACDLAEVIGTAVALNLLAGIPLWAGVLITAADVLIVLLFELKNFRFLELFIAALVAVVAGCFVFELAVSKPHWPKVMEGFIPRPEVRRRRALLGARRCPCPSPCPCPMSSRSRAAAVQQPCSSRAAAVQHTSTGCQRALTPNAHAHIHAAAAAAVAAAAALQVLTNGDMLYAAIGILGATVMPHVSACSRRGGKAAHLNGSMLQHGL